MSFRTGPLILIYNADFGVWPNLPKLKLETTCRFTADRHRLPDADAVVFHMPSMREEYPRRYPGQRWVAWSMECRANTPALADRDFMAQFDLTMGFWRGATVWTPYFDRRMTCRLLSRPVEKTEPAPLVYFQSSPIDRSGRLGLVRALMKRMRVDSYGKALNNRRLPGPDNGKTTKLETIARYKFTLAFENAIEDDYVTEKFFEPLMVGSVPVYLGAPNIADFAPGERCFINAADFDGPASLAEHLQRLCADDDAYRSYLAWKDRPLRPEFVKMAKAASGWSMHRLCGAVRAQCGAPGGGARSLSAIGRITTRPWALAMLRPIRPLLRRLMRPHSF